MTDLINAIGLMLMVVGGFFIVYVGGAFCIFYILDWYDSLSLGAQIHFKMTLLFGAPPALFFTGLILWLL